MDEYAFTELVTGMWVNTEHLVGRRRSREIRATFPSWSQEQIRALLQTLGRMGLLR